VAVVEYGPGAVFPGVIGRTAEESTPAWPAPVRAREGAPNVLVIVLDDTGFGQLGCYGSPIATPNFDGLAAVGLGYSDMHTTALCSPSRWCILTGRNHHSNAMAAITEFATGVRPAEGAGHRPGGRAAVAARPGTCRTGRRCRRLFARMMEVFAGFLSHTDHQVGRLIGFLRQLGELDNTLVMVVSDNGAWPACSPTSRWWRFPAALALSNGKPAQRGALLHDDDFTTVAKYGSEYAGLAQYYLLAQDVFRLGRLQWVMETSMLKTLAGKHHSTVNKMARKDKTTIESPTGPRRVFQVTVECDRGRKPLAARFGGIQLKRVRTAVLTDQRPVMASSRRNELIHRLLAGRCEICESATGLEVHHIRKLADLNKPGRREKPAWMHLMAMRRRNTLVICRRCHEDIHAGRATKPIRQ
jgi:hypothetical protein